ncbi:MAG TPA: hypothetical protein PLZ91_03230 [Bacteroidia bacterium]|nr:hypothetical protein [Bacteroidia bacterium]
MNHIPVGKCLRLLFFSLFLCFASNAQQSASSETELKKQAEKAFLSEKYEDALSPYSQLLSLYPNNTSYSYRYGVSLLLAGKNKANAVNYLEVAAKDPLSPQEVWIYLGQAYMVIGKFDDALGCFRKFESIVNATMLKKFNSDELKSNCMNAIELLKTRKNIAIISSRDVARNEFYKYYDWSDANGKLVPAAEQFLTTMDKDNQMNPVMFIANDKQTIYLSSYGKRGERGKDLYVIRKMPNGNWSTPENLGETINSEANEDFPYLDRDGRTLYFASKSKKSIGGYDIFKSKIDFNTGKWSIPENLGWPINTIADDYLYVPISKGAEAYYTTSISSTKSEIELRRIQLPDQGEALVTISGYYAPTDQRVRRDARITILKAGGEGIITSVYTDPNTGKYEVTLEPGLDYVIVVEGGGYLPHAENFTLPSKLDNSDLKQIVKINREKSSEKLVLENYFYPASAVLEVPSEVKAASYDTNVDSSSMMAIQINNQTVLVTKPGSGKIESVVEQPSENSNLVTIEKKDEYDPTIERSPSADEIQQKKEEEKRALELADDNKKSDNYDVTIGNEELASIAILDAKTSRQEADSLNREVERLKAGAIERDSLSAQMSVKAENATEQEKPSYLNEAYVLKADADNMRRQAADLKIAAMAKDTEAKASEQEANELLATINDGKSKKGSKVVAADKKPDTVVLPESSKPNEQIATAVVKTDETKATSDSTNQALLSDDKKENDSKVENKSETTPIGDNQLSTQEKTALAISSTEVVSNKEENENQQANQKANDTTNSITPMEAQANANLAGDSLTSVSEKSEVTVITDSSALVPEKVAENINVENKKESLPIITPDLAANDVSHEKSAQDVSSGDKSVVNNVAEETKVTETTVVDKTTEKSNDTTTSGTSIADNTTKSSVDSINKVDQSNLAVPKIDSGEKSAVVVETQTPIVAQKESEHDETISSKNVEPVVENEEPANVGIAANTSDTKTNKDNSVDSVPVSEIVIDKDQIAIIPTEDQKDSKKISDQEVAQNSPAITADEKIITKEQGTSIPDSKVEANPDAQKVNQVALATEVENNSDDEIIDVTTADEKAKTEVVAPKVESSVAENKTMPDSAISENSVPEIAINTKVENQESPEATEKSSGTIIENPDSVKPSPDVTTVELKPPFVVPVEEKKPLPENINTLKVNPVNEEARIAYQAFKAKYKNSKQLSDQSISLQNRITETKPSVERDSLIFVSNSLVEQSAAMYNDAIVQLKAAEAIDPDVQHKMEVNEQIIAYSSSMPTGNSEKDSPSLNDQTGPAPGVDIPEKTDSTEQQIASVAAETAGDKVEEGTSETVSEKVASDVPETANDKVESDTKDNLVTENSETTSETASAESYELTPEEAKAVEEATTFTVETPNGKEVVKIDTTGINTRHPEFRKYVEVNKEITSKQVETIDIFADAVNQNKIAVEQKQEQNRLMDKAEVEQDRPTKAQIFIQADAMRDSSKKNEEEAAAKFALAQSKTGEVKSKTGEMQEIRKRIARPGSQLPEQATKSTVSPEGLSQEEVLAMTKPEEKANTTVDNNIFNDNSGNSIPATTYTPEKVEQFAKQSFSIASAPVYNKENPIPMNPPIPDGLVFKVQIGAFRKEIPAEKFEGVQPITAETTRPSWVRYCVGLFQTFEPAVVVKKEMQQRGFKDAFVVAYLNGKRIGLDEAFVMIGKGKSSPDKTYVQNSQTEMALLRANNIRPENIASIRNNVMDEDEKSFYGENAANVKKSLAAIEYSVQVGVYKTQITPKGLQTLTPLFTEKIRSNLYRFTTDHYMSYASADSMKKVARREGVKDAFIVVYRNGVQSALSSVPIAERTKQSSSITNTVASTSVPSKTSTSTKPSLSNVEDARSPQNFPSAVTSGGKIIYRVQIGAFKNNIPFTAVVTFLNIADKGITQLTDDRGLHIFYAGTLDNFSSASALREEIVSKGVTDAFVVALQDGKRVTLTEEMKK